MLTHAAADGLRRRQPDLSGRLFASCVPAQLFGPRVWTRAVARLRGRSLDRALAGGDDPAQCPTLAARAAYLTSRGSRSRLAGTVERFVLAAGLPARRTTVRPSRRGVLANRDALRELASVLRSDAPVYARGIAELRLALGDGTGPLYGDRYGEAVARQLAVVRAGLRG